MTHAFTHTISTASPSPLLATQEFGLPRAPQSDTRETHIPLGKISLQGPEPRSLWNGAGRVQHTEISLFARLVYRPSQKSSTGALSQHAVLKGALLPQASTASGVPVTTLVKQICIVRALEHDPSLNFLGFFLRPWMVFRCGR